MKKAIDIFFNKKENHNQTLIKPIVVDYHVHFSGLLRIASSLQPKFKPTYSQLKLIRDLMFYFTGSEKYSKDLDKGIAIVGSVGCGKSLIFETFKIYTRDILKLNSFQFHAYTEILNDISQNGNAALDKFRFNKRTIVMYIDDFGKGKNEANHYGNGINLIDSLIDIRHICHEHGILTHFTTNFRKEDFKKFDSRTRDRMRQMFNQHVLSIKSFRK